MTNWPTRLRPEPGDSIEFDTATPTSGDGAAARILDAAGQFLSHIPPAAWVALLIGAGVATLITLPAAKRHIRRAGSTTPTDRRDQLLLAAALAPAAGFWLAVLAGSARGLIAFGRDDLRWTDGWEYLVPGTLDGIAISFGLLAFRAVRKGRSPDRAVRVAWGAMAASAGINYFHEAGLPQGSALAGGYLALMSLLGMLIFDELLAQFEDGTGEVRRANPKFGLRWLTWPSNTACAWVAWRNYPPADGTPATVSAAVEHLDEIRTLKRERRFAAVEARTVAPWWTPLLPWVRIRQLDARAEAERRGADERLAALAAEIDNVRSVTTANAEQARLEHAERDAVVRAERAAERAAAARALRLAEQEAASLRSRLAEQAERLAAEHAEQVTNLRAEHAEKIATLRASQDGTAGRNGRSNVTPMRRPKVAERTPNPMATDTGALAAMFAEHPETDFAWTDREVNRITGAGFSSRAPRLVGAATTHQKTCPAEQHSECFAERRDNDPEQEDSHDRELVG